MIALESIRVLGLSVLGFLVAMFLTPILALSLASGASMKEAAAIANYAAGITVGKVGTSTVSVDELKKSIEDE